jgi:hypothetical protein
LDRVNVGFAALTMNKELGLTAEMFGFGAGILLRLLHIPGAIQRFWKGRRPAMACQDHDLLGRDCRVVRVRAVDFHNIKAWFLLLR